MCWLPSSSLVAPFAKLQLRRPWPAIAWCTLSKVAWDFVLVTKLQLGNPVREAPASLALADHRLACQLDASVRLQSLTGKQERRKGGSQPHPGTPRTRGGRKTTPPRHSPHTGREEEGCLLLSSFPPLAGGSRGVEQRALPRALPQANPTPALPAYGEGAGRPLATVLSPSTCRKASTFSQPHVQGGVCFLPSPHAGRGRGWG